MSARREHGGGCSSQKGGGGCDCGGVPFFEVSIEKTKAGFGMMIGPDCTVTKFNGEPSAGQEAGVVLNSIVVRINDAPVEDKKQLVAQIKAAALGSAVSLRLIFPAEVMGGAAPPPGAPPPEPAPAATAAPTPAPAPKSESPRKAEAASKPASMTGAKREHSQYCGAKFGRPCDCGGVPCYIVDVTNVGGGYGMLIGADCAVTKYNGSPSAAEVAGVLLNSVIVRVNGVVVEDKKEIVAQIQAATAGTLVPFKMVPPPCADLAAIGLAAPARAVDTAAQDAAEKEKEAAEAAAAAKAAKDAADAKAKADADASAAAAAQREDEAAAAAAAAAKEEKEQAAAAANKAKQEAAAKEAEAAADEAAAKQREAAAEKAAAEKAAAEKAAEAGKRAEEAAAPAAVATREVGADCYTVDVTNVGGGYGMLIGADCAVTKYNGSPSAAEVAGVLLNSVIVRVNGVVVEDKKEIVAQIQAATAGTLVPFKMVRPAEPVAAPAIEPAPAPAPVVEPEPASVVRVPAPAPPPKRPEAAPRVRSSGAGSPLAGGEPEATFSCKHVTTHKQSASATFDSITGVF